MDFAAILIVNFRSFAVLWLADASLNAATHHAPSIIKVAACLYLGLARCTGPQSNFPLEGCALHECIIMHA
jgi:hypothetical protein